MPNQSILASSLNLVCIVLAASASVCVAQQALPVKLDDKSVLEANNPPSTLTLPGFGMEIPILTSNGDLDPYVGHVVAIRGPIGNSKVPRIIGVEVKGGHKLQDACAVGMLAKFVTTEAEWTETMKQYPDGMPAGFGPGTRYKLYSSMTGHGSESQAWGTGYTEDSSRIKVPVSEAAVLEIAKRAVASGDALTYEARYEIERKDGGWLVTVLRLPEVTGGSVYIKIDAYGNLTEYTRGM